jgi:chromosome partitioning related protein ParA
VEANRNSAYTVSLVSTKGGVGKSTLAANISALCTDLGLRVLVIDCDTQVRQAHAMKKSKHLRNL